MIRLKIKNKCKKLKLKFRDIIAGTLSGDSNWLQNHIAMCPKCQHRIRRVGNVTLALSLLKCQPHSLELLMNANTGAINVLKHSLRNSTKAVKLGMQRPEPEWPQKYGKYIGPIVNIAACIAVILLLKISVFSSMDSVQKQGRDCLGQYYAKHLGADYADEIFRS